MEIFHSLDQAAAKSAPSVVTIGAFDGIHLAHRELLRLVRERAARKGAVSVAITFEPHPLRVLAPQKAPKLLTPQPVRLELLASSGVDRLLVLPFTRDFSLCPPEKFVEEVLAKALRAVAVVVGDNFHFGYCAAGDVATLAELGKQWNFETEVFPAVHVRRMPVSSSQIRSLLGEGRIERANRLLGRPFSIRHPVESGLGIGRSQTVPTLNLAPYSEVLPATGVYVTQTRIIETRTGGEKRNEASGLAPQGRNDTDVSFRTLAQGVSPGFEKGVQTSPARAKEINPSAGSETDAQSEQPSRSEEPNNVSTPSRLLRSVTNVGYRPTFVERSLGVETHLLEPVEQQWSGPPPARIEVRFLYRLRDERKFDSPEELKAQILSDIRRTDVYFRRLRHFCIASNLSET